MVGAFSLAQWAQLLAGAVLALVFALYLSPLPTGPTIFVACLLPGLPLAASYGAMGLEFSLAQGAMAAWRFWRLPRRYLPGPGQTAAGYLTEANPARPRGAAGRRRRRAVGGSVGRLARSRSERPAEAGELLHVEALDRSGVLVTSEGALVRYLRVTAKNPLVMGDAERAQVSHAFGQLVARIGAGQSLQFYVEATPVRLDELLGHSRREADRALAPLEQSRDTELRERGAALRRLHEALRGSLELHADEQAAVELGYYVIVPFVPDQGLRVDWRAVLPGRRPRLARAPLRRPLESHRRVLRESLRLTDAVRADLEALDLSTRLLSGAEVADLLWRRFNPTAADRTPERRPGDAGVAAGGAGRARRRPGRPGGRSGGACVA